MSGGLSGGGEQAQPGLLQQNHDQCLQDVTQNYKQSQPMVTWAAHEGPQGRVERLEG